ncbi:MAG: argininosuccinate synthase [Planctomycetota bacterium]|nr:argininosuccinate synthase [Planctomycetota bacterium]
MPAPLDIVLAFSGGLDTSFCVPWLIERGYRVTTLFVDTGGVNPQERFAIEQRALELGASRHVTQDAGEDLWQSFAIPFIRSGATYQNQYPLLCSDRYIIGQRMVELAQEIGTTYLAHGCTAAGNDQFRFDQTIAALGEFDIIAPIRAIQSETSELRLYEEQYLKERGFIAPPKTARYTINENILGVTISGSEIDAFTPPSDETYFLTSPRSSWPAISQRATIGFEHGIPMTLNGSAIDGPSLLSTLHAQFGSYGVGRGIYTGDTTIGLKGRIVFESPALMVLLTAHRALEEAVLTRHQNAFKPIAAKRWVELVYEGFFFEPLRENLQAFIASTQSAVTGEVTIETQGGICMAISIDSPNILQRPDATYAQGAPWTSEEAQGFIKLYGQSSILACARDIQAPAIHETIST